MRRIVAVLLALSAVPIGAASTARSACAPRLLVLSAFPGEIDPLLSETTVTGLEIVDGRAFYLGTLRGNDVVLALSGIGLVNAEATTEAALDHFRCGADDGIDGIVFSGVSGGKTSIGDVVIPSSWTDDDGATWYPADETMLQTARDTVEQSPPPLARTVPAGDPACVGIDPRLVPTVTLEHQPRIIAGGLGRSSDPFGGRAFPCWPGGGDVFGCKPCRHGGAPPDLAGFVSGMVPFADPAFFFGYFESPPATQGYDAEDMETAAVARVAAQRGLPFIAFRALSDGAGDPLMLPGFPFQFFVYRQLAADNAAIVALAFLEAWAGG